MAKENTGRIRATPYRTRDRAFCPMCEKPVNLLTLGQAVDFAKMDLDDFSRMMKNNKLHRLHNRKGDLMICGESVFQLLSERKSGNAVGK